MRAAGFDVLVLCAREFQPPATHYPGVDVIHAPLDDAWTVPIQAAVRAAREVALRLYLRQRVLVTCNQGRNRSGLVSALALWYLGGNSGRRCADHVRARRPGALSNPVFYQWLTRLPARG